MHFRGCSGETNRLARSYHSGETGDLELVLRTLREREPGSPIALVGYSLGGNVLLKWLGQVGAAAHVDCAVAVSVPFELEKAAWRLERGFSRIYQARLLHSLKASVARKHRQELLPAELGDLSAVHSFRDFDDVVTAPLHGFRDASHYYQESSSRQYLKGIRVPTLILHALDDPFMTPDAVPTPAELSRCTTLELSRRGGHVGFVAGRWPWRPRYWLDERIPAFIHAHINQAADCGEQRAGGRTLVNE